MFVYLWIHIRTSAPYGLRGSNATWLIYWFWHYINCRFVFLLNFLPFFFIYFLYLLSLPSYLMLFFLLVYLLTLVLWHCRLGNRWDIRPVKSCHLSSEVLLQNLLWRKKLQWNRLNCSSPDKRLWKRWCDHSLWWWNFPMVPIGQFSQCSALVLSYEGKIHRSDAGHRCRT